MGEWVERSKERWMCGWMDGCMDGWREGWVDVRKEGWMDGWVEGTLLMLIPLQNCSSSINRRRRRSDSSSNDQGTTVSDMATVSSTPINVRLDRGEAPACSSSSPPRPPADRPITTLSLLLQLPPRLRSAAVWWLFRSSRRSWGLSVLLCWLLLRSKSKKLTRHYGPEVLRRQD